MTAIDLLNKYLDYSYLWNSPDRRNSKPSQSRLAQLEKMLEGFGISGNNVNHKVKMIHSIIGKEGSMSRPEYISGLTKTQYFSSGEFIQDRPKEKYATISAKIIDAVKLIHPHWSEQIDSRPVNLKWMFNNLLDFRQDIYKITYPNGGMLEGFVTGLEYSFYLQRKYKETMLDNVAEIDQILCTLIDPEDRLINKEDINYPEFDLESIDLQWRMENY